MVSFPCLKPIDREKVLELASRFSNIITVEEHSVIGGLGSAVAEILAEEGSSCRLSRMGMKDSYSTIVGTQQYLRSVYQLDDKAIAEKALELCKK